MSGPVVTVHIDGAARGNPGPAAFAFVIAQDGKPPIEEAGRMGARPITWRNTPRWSEPWNELPSRAAGACTSAATANCWSDR